MPVARAMAIGFVLASHGLVPGGEGLRKLFRLGEGHFGILGAPANKEQWDLLGAAFVITEIGASNHCCDPELTDAQLIEFMRFAIEFMEGPEGVDKELGMPSDGHRLVQKWSYSAFPHLVQGG